MSRARSTVQYERWAPVYERIRLALGLDWERERTAAARLRALLPAAAPPVYPQLARALRGRDAVVVGQAPGAGPPPIWRLPPTDRAAAILAADGAAATCLSGAIVPDVVVTDLDGPVESELTAEAQGARMVVHAHGDNVPALERWVPQFQRPIVATWAGPPDPPLLDFGGFTDGDRAAYLADAAGARRVLLWGFELDRVDPDEPDRSRKLEKLRWAAVALDLLASTSPGRLYAWQRDGRIEPYGAGRPGASTHSTVSA